MTCRYTQNSKKNDRKVEQTATSMQSLCAGLKLMHAVAGILLQTTAHYVCAQPGKDAIDVFGRGRMQLTCGNGLPNAGQLPPLPQQDGGSTEGSGSSRRTFLPMQVLAVDSPTRQQPLGVHMRESAGWCCVTVYVMPQAPLPKAARWYTSPKGYVLEGTVASPRMPDRDLIPFCRDQAAGDASRLEGLKGGLAGARQAFREACISATGTCQLADAEAALSAALQRRDRVPPRQPGSLPLTLCATPRRLIAAALEHPAPVCQIL